MFISIGWNREGLITSVYNNDKVSTNTLLKWIQNIAYYIKEAYNFVKEKIEVKKMKFYFEKFNWVLKWYKLDNLNQDLYINEANIIEEIFKFLECNFYDRNKNYTIFNYVENYSILHKI